MHCYDIPYSTELSIISDGKLQGSSARDWNMNKRRYKGIISGTSFYGKLSLTRKYWTAKSTSSAYSVPALQSKPKNTKNLIWLNSYSVVQEFDQIKFFVFLDSNSRAGTVQTRTDLLFLQSLLVRENDPYVDSVEMSPLHLLLWRSEVKTDDQLHFILHSFKGIHQMLMQQQ